MRTHQGPSISSFLPPVPLLACYTTVCVLWPHLPSPVQPSPSQPQHSTPTRLNYSCCDSSSHSVANVAVSIILSCSLSISLANPVGEIKAETRSHRAPYMGSTPNLILEYFFDKVWLLIMPTLVSTISGEYLSMRFLMVSTSKAAWESSSFHDETLSCML